MHSLSALLKWISQPTPVPPSWLLAASVALGAVLACVPAVWRRTRLLATYLHEAGHALVALLCGRRVTSIRLEADTSGVTGTVGPRGGLGSVLTAMAGYPAPALAGMGAVLAVSDGRARLALGVLAGVSAALCVVQRSWRGWAVTLGILASCWLLAGAGGAPLGLALGACAGYLLAASPRTVVELHRGRVAHRDAGAAFHSDADALAGMTGLPAVLWEAAFLVACAACAWHAALALR